MSYCTHCGTHLDDDAIFCSKCGHKNLALVHQETENISSKKKKKWILPIIVILAIFVGVAAVIFYAPEKEIPFSDNPDAISQAASSVVKLNCYDESGELFAFGSGFAMFEDGVFVTNYHVISEGVYSIVAQREDGLSFDIDYILAYDEAKDIAIMKTSASPSMSLLVQGTPDSMSKGESVVAIGSPLGLINSVSEGTFSGFINEDGFSFLQFSAAISHGSSGGPLFDDQGNVIGITCGSYEDGQNVNLAVPINDVVDVWEKRDTEAIQVSDFFAPLIPCYSVDYVYNHFSELKGQEITVEGYISYVYYGDGDKYIGLIDSPEEIIGTVYYKPQKEESYSSICMQDSIDIWFENVDSETFKNTFIPGEYISCTGFLEFYVGEFMYVSYGIMGASFN